MIAISPDEIHSSISDNAQGKSYYMACKPITNNSINSKTAEISSNWGSSSGWSTSTDNELGKSWSSTKLDLSSGWITVKDL